MIPDSVKLYQFGLMDQRRSKKKRFTAAAMILLQKKHQIHIHWNVFATSHSKGLVDGIGPGGAVKRYVWTTVKQRKEIVVNRACSFVEAVVGIVTISHLI